MSVVPQIECSPNTKFVNTILFGEKNIRVLAEVIKWRTSKCNNFHSLWWISNDKWPHKNQKQRPQRSEVEAELKWWNFKLRMFAALWNLEEEWIDSSPRDSVGARKCKPILTLPGDQTVWETYRCNLHPAHRRWSPDFFWSKANLVLS